MDGQCQPPCCGASRQAVQKAAQLRSLAASIPDTPLCCRFVASIETCVATWAAKQAGERPQRLQAQLQHRFPWRSETYTLALQLPPAADPAAQHGRAQPQQPGPPQQEQHRLGQQPGSAAAWPLADGAALRDAPDRLQQWFGVRAFLLLTPDSYSGRVLEEEVRRRDGPVAV